MKRITTLLLSFAFAALPVGEDPRFSIIRLAPSPVVALPNFAHAPHPTSTLAPTSFTASASLLIRSP